MMKYFNILLVALIVFLGGNISLGQENKFSAVYDFHVHNPEQLQGGKILIEVLKGGINSCFGRNLDYIEMDITDSITRVLVSIPKRASYLRLGVSFGQLEGDYSLINLHVENNLFLVEDRDKVEVHLYPKEINPIIFKGDAAAKYTAQYEIAGEIPIKDVVHVRYRELMKERRFTKAFEVLNHWADSAVLKIATGLDDRNISQPLKEVLLCDYTAAVYNSKWSLIQSYVEIFTNDLELQRATLTEVSKATGGASDFDANVASMSIKWGDMLLYREWLKFALERHPDKVEIIKDNDYGFANYLAERHTGILRDKLFYLALIRQWDMYGLRTVAIPMMEDNRYAEAFRTLSSRMEGAEILDVEMQDKDGKIHRFADYKGKVLIVDMWYTGCIPCKFLAKELKAMQYEIQGLEDVVFLSLSFDKKIDVWKKSLESREYTPEKGVDLWIGEKAMKHPIVEHYSIRGVPQLMIVDKEGKLAVRNALRPARKDPVAWNGFKKMVEFYR